MKSQNKSSIPQIAITNFSAVLLVVLFHYARGVYPFNGNQFLSVVLNSVNGIMSYFFVLSGYLLAINYYHKQPIDIKIYYISRFARIYPVYLLALQFWIISHLMKGVDFNELINILLTLFLIQSWVPHYSQTYNYPTWFLSVLMFFYIIFPYVFSYISNKNNSRLFTLASLAWFINAILIFTYYNRPVFMSGYNEIYNMTVYHPLIMYMSPFIVGVAGGVFVVRNKNMKYPDAIPIIMVLIALVTSWFIFSLDTWITGGRTYYPNGLLSPLFLLLIIGLSLDKTALSQFLSNNLFIALGSISYSMYILHVPIRVIINRFFGINIMTSSLRIFTYLIILLVCSSVIYAFFEKPMRKYIVSNFNRK